jgi:hypothetical protein
MTAYVVLSNGWRQETVSVNLFSLLFSLIKNFWEHSLNDLFRPIISELKQATFLLFLRA